jgi:hypothetical protein
MSKNNLNNSTLPKSPRFSHFAFRPFPFFLFLISYFFSFHLNELHAQPSPAYIYLGTDDYAFVDYLINSGRKIGERGVGRIGFVR